MVLVVCWYLLLSCIGCMFVCVPLLCMFVCIILYILLICRFILFSFVDRLYCFVLFDEWSFHLHLLMCMPCIFPRCCLTAFNYFVVCCLFPVFIFGCVLSVSHVTVICVSSLCLLCHWLCRCVCDMCMHAGHMYSLHNYSLWCRVYFVCMRLQHLYFRINCWYVVFIYVFVCRSFFLFDVCVFINIIGCRWAIVVNDCYYCYVIFLYFLYCGYCWLIVFFSCCFYIFCVICLVCIFVLLIGSRFH